ncbi:MAG: DNA-directed RNA polymerase subunit A'', partial [Promethearchaeota archaeon]
RLLEQKINTKQLSTIIKEVEAAYDNALVQPGEAVGAVAAQSIGEPGTQMSISGSEKVLIRQGSMTSIVSIGAFVDELIARIQTSSELSEPDTSEVCDIPSELEIYVPSLGNDERVHWKRLVQVSRHLPNGELLRISTRSGRSITATLSHSFVIRKNNTILPFEGKDLKIGDRIPVVRTLPSETPLKELPIEIYLPRNEIWYGSELEKAAMIREETGRDWLQHLDTVSIPVGADGLRVALDTDKTQTMVSGLVYPKAHHSAHTKIPEVLELDSLTGWFIGAYLAEGSNSGTFLSITNSDENYRKRAIEFAERLGLHYKEKPTEGVYGPSTSIVIYSTLLARLFEKMCGKGAHGKHVPQWALNCTDNFIGALLKAYFDGDGNVNLERSCIRTSSSSKELRDGICLLLSRLGIQTSKYSSENHDGHFQYWLRIPGKLAPQFRDRINFDIAHKRELLEQLANCEEEKIQQKSVTYDQVDMVPNFGTILNEIARRLRIPSQSSLAASIRKYSRTQLIGRQTLGRYITIFSEIASKKNINIDNQLQLLHRAYHSGVFWDEIIRLELIPSPTEWVYDFSVDGLETFVTSEGIITHNTLKTFHFAGVAEFNVTLGLPRLIEIVDARRNPSTPTMNVYLDEGHRENEKLARNVAQSIEQTRVERVAETVEIDLAEGGIVVILDPKLLEDKATTSKEIAERLEAIRPNLGEVTQDGNRIIVAPELREGEEAMHMAKLQKTFDKVRNGLIKGQDGIKRVLIKKEGTEWVLYTEGTNLKGVLRTKGVDTTRTVSNHIHEIAETLGIESARQVIINEAKDVLDEQGLDVDIRHIMLVADLMTATGEIRQIGRHGVSGEQSSVLARAAFEVTVRHLIQASILGEEDNLLGITENVIIGQSIPLGTGSIDLFMNPPRTAKKK